ESSSIREESDFYKDKSRRMEIQLNKAVGSERAMNENALVLEQKNIFLEEEIARLQQQGVRDFEKLAREAQQMQLQLSEISGREQMTERQLKNLQTENSRLMDELQNLQQRELDYNRQISLLNENNNNLLQQIESTQRLRLRLRNDIIGVIDQNDQSPR
ncbi:MAG: hypothetical protein VX371_01440, partial [Verrucomicrobiota bacterium]|nr:hypothetical protein [Verrucomicrobiota bacterium]